MRPLSRFPFGKGMSLLSVAITILLIAAGPIYSQQWQWTYGNPSCWELGAKGGQKVSTGGYIFAGHAAKTSGCTPTTGMDTYVVHTDNNGVIIWSKTYHMRNFDRVADIQECAGGGFIVTGTTAAASSGTTAAADIFLLRLDAAGVPIWAKTYGAANNALRPYGVIETAYGNGLPPGAPGATAAGDFVVCGVYLTTAGSGGGHYALLLRTDANGNLIWDMRYRVDTYASAFYDVIETTLNGAGDIVAAGQADLPLPRRTEVFVARVNSTNGTIGAAPQGASVFGDTTGNDILYSIKESIAGTGGNGQLVGIGSTTSRPPGSSSTSQEILAISMNNICDDGTIVMQIYGDDGNKDEYGSDLQEIRSLSASFTTGNFVATGGTYINGNFGSTDAFLLELDKALLPGTIPFTVYGGTRIEYGASIAVAEGGSTTDGFIICGTEESKLSGPQAVAGDIYAIKTDAFGTTGTDCLPRHPELITYHLRRMDSCVTPVDSPFVDTTTIRVTVDSNDWGDTVCLTGPVTTPKRNNMESGILTETSRLSIKEISPNPIRAGVDIVMNVFSQLNAPARLVVTDLLGKEVHSELLALTAGSSPVLIPTRNWAAGTYIVSVQAGDESVNCRISIY